MNRRCKTLTLAMAALVATAIPALARTACACEPGSTGVGVAPIDAAVARIVQDSPAFPSTAPGHEVIETGSPADVTYHVAYFDRNGEADFETPIPGRLNPQQVLGVEILRPDGTYITDADAITVPASNGCSLLKVLRTPSTSVTWNDQQPATGGVNLGFSWILTDWDDHVAGNGIVTCDIRVSFNNGSATPIGSYIVRPSITTALLQAPQVGLNEINLYPIGHGPFEDVTTTIYNLLAVTTTIGGANGTIDFGTIRPGELGLANIRVTGAEDIVVANREDSQPVNLVVSVKASDLVHNQTDPDSLINPARTYAPIPCDRIAIAMDRTPTPGDALQKTGAGSSFCDTAYFEAPTLNPGQKVTLNAGLLEPGAAINNFAFAAGRYTGTIEVCLMGPGGQGDPVVVGDPPENPVPSFNENLAMPVDDVGRIQSAA